LSPLKGKVKPTPRFAHPAPAGWAKPRRIRRTEDIAGRHHEHSS